MSHTHHGRKRRKAVFTQNQESTMKTHNLKSPRKSLCGVKRTKKDRPLAEPRPGKNATCDECQRLRPRNGVVGTLSR